VNGIMMNAPTLSEMEKASSLSIIAETEVSMVKGLVPLQSYLPVMCGLLPGGTENSEPRSCGSINFPASFPPAGFTARQNLKALK
jgi:hypothetical protein